jgi:hypothetical protein
MSGVARSARRGCLPPPARISRGPPPRLVTGIEVLAAVLHPGAASWDIPEGVIAELSRGAVDFIL